jgi:hypothetical protein
MEQLAALEKAWGKHLESDSHGPRSKRTYCYASGRRSCVRRMALDMMHPEDEPEAAVDALERMQKGKEREVSLIARLMQIGPRCSPSFEVIEGQGPVRIKDEDGLDLIHGKLDCRLDFGSGGRPPAEAKSGQMAARISSIEDMDRSPWTRSWPDQLLSYLYATNEPWGFFILERPGMPLFLPVRLEDHMDRVESFLVDARSAVLAAKGEAELPAFTDHLSDCRRCPHLNKSCTPPVLSAGPGLKVIEDLDLIALAETREENEEGYRAYGHADKGLKEALRGVEHGVLGPFEVSGKWGKSTRLEMPEELKKKYQVVDPEGKFTLKIERAFEKTETPALTVTSTPSSLERVA